MSPLAEKLAAVLADWNELVAALSEAKKQIASREDAIINLQQQYIRQAAEITSLRGQVTLLEEQVQDALLSASDPDDARLLSRIEAAYATLSPKGSEKPEPQKHSEKSSDSSKAAQLAANLAPPVSAPADVASPATTKSSSKPARAAQPTAQGAAPSLRDVVFKLVE